MRGRSVAMKRARRLFVHLVRSAIACDRTDATMKRCVERMLWSRMYVGPTPERYVRYSILRKMWRYDRENYTWHEWRRLMGWDRDFRRGFDKRA